MKILHFGASTSQSSINIRLASIVAHKLPFTEIKSLDLSVYQLPIYSIDTENTIGIPAEIKEIYKHIAASDLIVISLAEHNGSYTTGFKNIFDWLLTCPL
jgi:NAD(P)H-dependent FMN reductase